MTYTKRNKLTVKNYTHLDIEDSGLTFKLCWKRDVDGGRDETPKLEPRQEVTKNSRGIGNGHNMRHFEVEVLLLWEDQEHSIGTFTHNIYAPPGSTGVHEDTEIRFDIENWVVYRLYIKATPNDVQQVRDNIGLLPVRITK